MEAQGRAYAALELWGPKDEVDLAVAYLVERGSTGAEEHLEGGRCTVYFPESTGLTDIIRDLESTLPGVFHRALPALPQRDWLAEWKRTLTGFALGETFFVLPTWLPCPDVGRREILRIDPEQAFGTGLHDTTRLTVELLEEWMTPGKSVLDIGTGTGILSMVAARLGARPITAIEPDAAAADCALKNLELNELTNLVTVVCAALEDYEPLAADIVVANVNAAVLVRALPLVRGDVVLLSGILVEEVDEFVSRLPRPYELSEERSAGEWSALVLTR